MAPTQLSPVQDKVIAALSNGDSLSTAADAAGVHRNTIANWRRTSAQFRAALADAHYDRAMLVRERADALAGRAIYKLEEILMDKESSPSVRLRAALAIIAQASTPPPEPPRLFIVEPAEPLIPEPKTLHNSAQAASTTYVRDEPKTGRNEACPCGSGRKFKQCCLNNQRPNHASGDPKTEHSQVA